MLVDDFIPTALLTDRYELSMVDAALRSGLADRRAVFEVFARDLPAGRRYGVVAGLGRLVAALDAFRFGPAELAFIEGLGAYSPALLEWCAAYRFRGSVDGYREGELFFPHSPVLTVEAPFADALVLETLVLSVLNFDSAVASAAARMHVAAAGRGLVEMGGRRTHEWGAVAAARAACVAGFDASSNLEAGRRWGVPTMGTVGHAFVLAAPDELAAFRVQVETLGPGSTFLVDTYDIAHGIRVAVEAAGADRLGGVRIDSGDLAFEVVRARALLDELGARQARIVVTGDLDERRMAAMASLPVDSFGVGTQVVVGSGAPTALFVYKLVAIAESSASSAPLRPVEKRSAGKATVGGRKAAWRLRDGNGRATEELVVGWGSAPPGGHARALQVAVVRDGEVVHRPTLKEVRSHHLAVRGELAPEHLALEPGPPVFHGRPERSTRGVR